MAMVHFSSFLAEDFLFSFWLSSATLYAMSIRPFEPTPALTQHVHDKALLAHLITIFPTNNCTDVRFQVVRSSSLPSKDHKFN